MQNPNHALAAILASLHDTDGRVAVPGFGVLACATSRSARSPSIEASYQRDVGVPALWGEPGFSTLSGCGHGPRSRSTGCTAAATSPSSRARPARTSLRRPVPGQDPDARCSRRSRTTQVAPPGVTVRVIRQPGAVPAYELDPAHPAVTAAVGALRHAYPGSAPLLVRIGGTPLGLAVMSSSARSA